MLTKAGVISLVALVAQNTSLVLLLKHSFRDEAIPYSRSTAVLMLELVKFSCCVLVTICRSESPIRIIQDIGQHGFLWIPSVLYVVQNNLLLFGASKLTSIEYMICTQSKIFATAVISRVALGTKISVQQYLSLIALAVGITVVQIEMSSKSKEVQPDFGVDPQPKQRVSHTTAGIAAVLAASLISGFAGVTLEKIFKGKQTHDISAPSIWSRNLQLSLISVPFALSGIVWHNRESFVRDAPLRGFDAVVQMMVLNQAVGGIITGYVMRHANNILKCAAVSISICFCAFVSIARGETLLSFWLLGGVVLVVLSVLGYALPLKIRGNLCNHGIS